MPQPGPPARRAGLWCVFWLVHAALTWLGVVLVPARAFWDLDLYRWWTARALLEGTWPVLDEAWVYPAGALVPMLVPHLGGEASTARYALGWCLLVTVLDGAALSVLVRLPSGTTAGWWWTGALAALGPVALGRLDAVVTPLTVIALALAAGSTAGSRAPGATPMPAHPPAATRAAATRAAATLLAVGAWVKVAPGPLLLPLAAAARRPWRDVVLPGALVCAVVAGVVGLAGGPDGAGRLLSFLGTQTGRGLQVEAVAATPWMLAAGAGAGVEVRLDPELITYQVDGPGTVVAAGVLDAVMILAVLAVAAVLLVARRRDRARAALLPAALVLGTLLLVTNKVGSPQLMTGLVPPIAVLLAATSPRRPRWLVAAAGTALLTSALTQVVFPWGYPALLAGSPAIALVLAARNLTLVVVLVLAVAGLRAAVRDPRTPGVRASVSPAAA